MDHGSYFLATASLFESRYRGSDGVIRNTAYNTNYMLNILGGKELTIRNRNKKARFIKKFLIDGKLNWAGGQRYIPIDLEASRAVGITMYDYENAYGEQLKDYFRIDLRIGYKWIGRGASYELALDIQNVTNRINPFQIKYDNETGEIKTIGSGLTPDLLYRVRF
jgi:outer membrane receptor protein involved in Fe transport